jgi:hypothetical protein
MSRKIVLAALAAAVSACVASAADVAVKKAPPPAAAPSLFDLAFGGAIMSDYNFRGISQSNHSPSVFAYFEPRVKPFKEVELYAGIAGYSIAFPNRSPAEIDIYGGARMTFGSLLIDIGLLYYYYPDGQCFNTSPPGTPDCAVQGPLPNGNVIKADLSFLEFYVKSIYTLNDQVSIGAAIYYAENWLNSGAEGTYGVVTAKFTAPSNLLPSGLGLYASGELAHYWLGTTDSFYGIPGTIFAAGVPLPDYLTWNVGFGVTYKVFTLDFRYYDTDLSPADCNVLTSDHTATFSPANITPINPGGLGSTWCDAAFIVKLSADLTMNTNLK